MKGYKIVKVDHDNFMSFNALLAPEAHLVYEIGKWTKPCKESGPLAVFASKLHARFFYEDYDSIYHLKLFECEYTPVWHKSLWVKDKLFGTIRLKLTDAPRGTTLAKAVKLIKEIKDV